MAKLTAKAENRRRAVELSLMRLNEREAFLDLDILRVRQAVQRSGLGDLLEPVVEDLSKLHGEVKYLKQLYGEVWKDEQARKWGGDQPGLPGFSASP